MSKFKLKKGDKVIILTGKDKGKSGEIISFERTKGKVKVQGLNLVKRHVRQTAAAPASIVSKEAFLDVSNVASLDPKLNVATKVGYKFIEDAAAKNGLRKVRYAKKSGEVIEG